MLRPPAKLFYRNEGIAGIGNDLFKLFGVERLLGFNNRFTLFVGRFNLFNAEVISYGVVYVAFAHSAGHSFDFKYRLSHFLHLFKKFFNRKGAGNILQCPAPFFLMMMTVIVVVMVVMIVMIRTVVIVMIVVVSVAGTAQGATAAIAAAGGFSRFFIPHKFNNDSGNNRGKGKRYQNRRKHLYGSFLKTLLKA